MGNRVVWGHRQHSGTGQEVPTPWSSTTSMDQKTKFIADHLRGTSSISELCTSYGTSRKTGYKWIGRYLHEGPAGLEDQSRSPTERPTRRPYTSSRRCSKYVAIIRAGAPASSWRSLRSVTAAAT